MYGKMYQKPAKIYICICILNQIKNNYLSTKMYIITKLNRNFVFVTII